MKQILQFLTIILLISSCTNPAPKTAPTNQISPTTNTQFTFNQGIANYKLDQATGKTYKYVDTKKPTEIVEAMNTMVFTEMGTMDANKRTDLFWFWIDSISMGKTRVFDNNELQQVKINGYDALVFDAGYTKAGKNGAIYMALLAKGDHTVKFVGTAYGDVSNTRKQFQETVASIKFK